MAPSLSPPAATLASPRSGAAEAWRSHPSRALRASSDHPADSGSGGHSNPARTCTTRPPGGQGWQEILALPWGQRTGPCSCWVSGANPRQEGRSCGQRPGFGCRLVTHELCGLGYSSASLSLSFLREETVNTPHTRAGAVAILLTPSPSTGQRRRTPALTGCSKKLDSSTWSQLLVGLQRPAPPTRRNRVLLATYDMCWPSLGEAKCGPNSLHWAKEGGFPLGAP